MAEQKAVPLNLVVSDKGKKAVRIGKAFWSGIDAKCPLSITVDLNAIQGAIRAGTVTEQDYTGNPQYPDEVLDNKKVLRMAGFGYSKRG